MILTVSWCYSQFQVTFHCKIPNFVAKFGSSLRSSKVHFRIRKPVCKLSIWLASLSSGANHSLCLQTGLWILKWTFELRNELPNFTTKFGTLQWKVIWNRLYVFGWKWCRWYYSQAENMPNHGENRLYDLWNGIAQCGKVVSEYVTFQSFFDINVVAKINAIMISTAGPQQAR